MWRCKDELRSSQLAAVLSFVLVLYGLVPSHVEDDGQRQSEVRTPPLICLSPFAHAETECQPSRMRLLTIAAQILHAWQWQWIVAYYFRLIAVGSLEAKCILVVVVVMTESRSCKYRNNEAAAPRLRQGSTSLPPNLSLMVLKLNWTQAPSGRPGPGACATSPGGGKTLVESKPGVSHTGSLASNGSGGNRKSCP